MSIFGKKTTEDKKEDKKPEKQTQIKVVKKEEKKPSMKELYAQESGPAKAAGKIAPNAKKYGSAYKILARPLVTEKGSMLNAAGKYIFEVAKEANKIEIAKAISEVYGVKPIDINVINYEGKKARRGKITGKRKNWKKAIITLPKGESIQVYEGV